MQRTHFNLKVNRIIVVHVTWIFCIVKLMYTVFSVILCNLLLKLTSGVRCLHYVQNELQILQRLRIQLRM